MNDAAPSDAAPDIVYYSSASGNTARFVARLGGRAARVPISPKDAMPEVTRPFVLICPTYADGEGRGAVPKRVIRFLNDAANREKLLGVIGTGNRNFGTLFASAGDVIARKCNVPLLYKFELAGTETDIARVRAGLLKLGEELCSTRA